MKTKQRQADIYKAIDYKKTKNAVQQVMKVYKL